MKLTANKLVLIYLSILLTL